MTKSSPVSRLPRAELTVLACLQGYQELIGRVPRPLVLRGPCNAFVQTAMVRNIFVSPLLHPSPDSDGLLRGL